MSFKVVGIGEVLWDLLPSGPQLGGAPVNFAFHAHQLGADARVITRVGNDEFGRLVLERFAEMAIDTCGVQVDEVLPTGTARVELADDGTPRFKITESVAWDALALTDNALEAVHGANAICFGTLAQRSNGAASVVQRLVAMIRNPSLRIFDVNLRPGFCNWPIVEQSLGIANVLKLNDEELAVLSPKLGLSGSARQKISQLAGRFDLEVVALTRADRGSVLFRNGSYSELSGRKVQVLDSIGAGDAFTAALVLGLLNQLSLEEVHRRAADIASFVCTQSGATPVMPLNLRTTFVPNRKSN